MSPSSSFRVVIATKGISKIRINPLSYAARVLSIVYAVGHLKSYATLNGIGIVKFRACL